MVGWEWFRWATWLNFRLTIPGWYKALRPNHVAVQLWIPFSFLCIRLLCLRFFRDGVYNIRWMDKEAGSRPHSCHCRFAFWDWLRWVCFAGQATYISSTYSGWMLRAFSIPAPTKPRFLHQTLDQIHQFTATLHHQLPANLIRTSSICIHPYTTSLHGSSHGR